MMTLLPLAFRCAPPPKLVVMHCLHGSPARLQTHDSSRAVGHAKPCRRCSCQGRRSVRTYAAGDDPGVYSYWSYDDMPHGTDNALPRLVACLRPDRQQQWRPQVKQQGRRWRWRNLHLPRLAHRLATQLGRRSVCGASVRGKLPLAETRRP